MKITKQNKLREFTETTTVKQYLTGIPKRKARSLIRLLMRGGIRSSNLPSSKRLPSFSLLDNKILLGIRQAIGSKRRMIMVGSDLLNYFILQKSNQVVFMNVKYKMSGRIPAYV